MDSVMDRGEDVWAGNESPVLDARDTPDPPHSDGDQARRDRCPRGDEFGRCGCGPDTPLCAVARYARQWQSEQWLLDELGVQVGWGPSPSATLSDRCRLYGKGPPKRCHSLGNRKAEEDGGLTTEDGRPLRGGLARNSRPGLLAGWREPSAEYPYGRAWPNEIQRAHAGKLAEVVAAIERGKGGGLRGEVFRGYFHHDQTLGEIARERGRHADTIAEVIVSIRRCFHDACLPAPMHLAESAGEPGIRHRHGRKKAPTGFAARTSKGST